jgi:hypothetical protein
MFNRICVFAANIEDMPNWVMSKGGDTVRLLSYQRGLLPLHSCIEKRLYIILHYNLLIISEFFLFIYNQKSILKQ